MGKISSGYLTPSAPSFLPSSSSSSFLDPRSDHPFDKMAHTPASVTASTTHRVISSGSDTTIEPKPLVISYLAKLRFATFNLQEDVHVDNLLALLLGAVNEFQQAFWRGPGLLLFCSTLIGILQEPIA